LIRVRAHTNPSERFFAFSSKTRTATAELVGEDGADTPGVTKK